MTTINEIFNDKYKKRIEDLHPRKFNMEQK